MLSSLLALLGLVALREEPDGPKTLWASFASAAFLSIGVFGFAQLDLRSLKVSPRLAEVARNVPCANPQVATLGYREPSLVFLTGTDLDMLETGAEAAGLPAARAAAGSFSSKSASRASSGRRTSAWSSSPCSRPAFRDSISTAGGGSISAAYADGLLRPGLPCEEVAAMALDG